MATLHASPISRPAPDLGVDEEERLLDLARFAVVAAARGEPELATRAAEERLTGVPAVQRRRGAAFVTLEKHGALRGCIGVLDAERPLAESVALAAVAATLDDWRFGPVAEEELPAMAIEVSVLGPMVRLDDPTALELGRDGIVVQQGTRRGLLLPEVATDHGMDRIELLDAACDKAGLRRGAWREPGTSVSAFRTRRFGGPAIAR